MKPHFASLALCIAALPVLQDPAKDLKSKEFSVRKAAVEALIAAGDEDAAKDLLKALGDEDWEIAELAARGLAGFGEKAGKGATKALVELALEGPVRRLRRTAAEALAVLAPVEASEELVRKLGGKTSQVSSEALGDLHRAAAAGTFSDRDAPKALVKSADKGKEYAERVAATHALLLIGAKDRAQNLAELLQHEALGVRCTALEVVAEKAAVADLAPVAELLLEPALGDVVERRALAAAQAALAAQPDGERDAAAKKLLDELAKAGSAPVARRAPRLAALLPADQGAAAIRAALGHADARVRAAAAKALAALGNAGDGEASADARRLAGGDKDARVRRAALATVLALSGKEELAEELVTWLAERLKADDDARTREDLAVALGRKGLSGALPALSGALADADPWVRVCAAVSLGKTRLEDAVGPLAQKVSDADWRLRGACVVGLGQTFQKAAVPHLIARVEDEEPSVARAAVGYLEALSKRSDIAATVAAWTAWWAEKEKTTTLTDPETADERAKKYGYGTNWEQIYGGLDVIVLESRGDHIQHVLQKLAVEHRMTQAANVGKDALRPQGVLVANCTGEIEAPDIERIGWFLRCGGYVFGSCWAVTHTIDEVYPGVLKQYETSGEVIDTVSAAPASRASAYLEGVFEDGVRPLYSLIGAHLIEVSDPERAEVLVDSPECAERWGDGNLAAWFPAGHGVVLDSVNHFEEQGLANASGLKKPIDRQAYAVDHMGLSLEKLRETRDAEYWDSSAKAGREVLDLSVFRLVTNFVRHKRLGGH